MNKILKSCASSTSSRAISGFLAKQESAEVKTHRTLYIADFMLESKASSGLRHLVQTQMNMIGWSDFYARPSANAKCNDMHVIHSVIASVLIDIKLEGVWEHIAAQGTVHVHLAMPFSKAARHESLDEFKRHVVNPLLSLQEKIARPLMITVCDYPLFNFDRSDDEQVNRAATMVAAELRAAGAIVITNSTFWCKISSCVEHNSYRFSKTENLTEFGWFMFEKHLFWEKMVLSGTVTPELVTKAADPDFMGKLVFNTPKTIKCLKEMVGAASETVITDKNKCEARMTWREIDPAR